MLETRRTLLAWAVGIALAVGVILVVACALPTEDTGTTGPTLTATSATGASAVRGQADAGAPAPDPADVPEATLYVSTDGDDAHDGRTPETAFRTIQKAADVVRPGDTVHVRGGTYPIQVFFRRSGTAEQPITWTSYPGEWAVLDGSDQEPQVSSHRVWVEDVDHNRFLNFEVANSPRQGIYVMDSDRNLFRNIVTHGNHGSGIQSTRSDHNRYEYIVAFDNFDSRNPGRPGEDADGIGFHDGEGNVIHASVAYHNSDDGFDTWRSTGSVVDSSIAHHNGIGRQGDGNGFKAGGERQDVRTIVQNSIAYANRSNGFDYNSGRNVAFLNNTAFENEGSAFVAGPTTVLRNNIAVGPSPNDFDGADSAFNSWDLGIPPGFTSTDPASPEFLSLADDSPSVDAGTDVGLPYDGEAPDLGALPHGTTHVDLVGPLDPAFASTPEGE